MAILVTGAASGMGAATVDRLRAAGKEVVGADLTTSDLTADLSTVEGRESVVEGVRGLELEGVAAFAGVSGFGGRSGALVVSTNYFGSVHLFEGLRLALAQTRGAGVAVSSNSATTAPGIDAELVETCLAGDEPKARALADEIGGPGAYAASKLALARWVRRNAPSEAWAGSGVSLNALAPGHIETGLTAEMMQEPEAASVIARSPLPIGRPGQPEEIAALTEFLLGEEGRFLVGSVLFIDGGVDALRRADDFPTARPPRKRA